MQIRYVLSAFLCLVAFVCSAAVAPDHPIVGTWTIRVPATQCDETDTFRPDGTTQVKSGRETSESTYTISATPSAAGYYALTDTVVNNNGEPDCTGAVIPIGDIAKMYLHFEPSNNAFWACPAEARKNCVGPFVRVPPGASI